MGIAWPTRETEVAGLQRDNTQGFRQEERPLTRGSDKKEAREEFQYLNNQSGLTNENQLEDEICLQATMKSSI